MINVNHINSIVYLRFLRYGKNSKGFIYSFSFILFLSILQLIYKNYVGSKFNLEFDSEKFLDKIKRNEYININILNRNITDANIPNNFINTYCSNFKLCLNFSSKEDFKSNMMKKYIINGKYSISEFDFGEKSKIINYNNKDPLNKIEHLFMTGFSLYNSKYGEKYSIIVKIYNIKEDVLSSDSFLSLFISLIFLLLLVMLTVSYSVEDIHSECRNYLILCGMTKVSYWIGSLLADLITYVSCIIVFHTINMISDHSKFFRHVIISIMICPGVIVTCYTLVFVFESSSYARNVIVLFFYSPVLLFVLLNNDTGSSVPAQSSSFFLLMYPLNSYFTLFTRHDGNVILFYLTGQILYVSVLTLLLVIFETIFYKTVESHSFNERGVLMSMISSRNRVILDKHSDEIVQMYTKDIYKNKNNKYFLRCVNISHAYGFDDKSTVVVANNISIGVKKNEIFGILGTNGSGKTSLFKIITRKIHQLNGEVFINNRNIQLGDVGYCPQFEDHLYRDLTFIENIRVFSKFYSYSKSRLRHFFDKSLNILDMNRYLDKQFSLLSGGNKKKLSFIISLMSPSSVILLDEPTSSLDINSRYLLHKVIYSFKKQKTFVLTTHILSEAEKLCDNLVLISEGSICAAGSPEYLISYFGKSYNISILLSDPSYYSYVNTYLTNTFPYVKLMYFNNKNLVYNVESNIYTYSSLYLYIDDIKQQTNIILYFTVTMNSFGNIFQRLFFKNSSHYVH